MIEAARHQAAIEVLDAILSGTAPEPALSGWARSHRFAGSGDRAAIRDIVFDALRRKRSAAAAGGAETGRGLILGLLRLAGMDPSAVFTGEGHAPAALDRQELSGGMTEADMPQAVALDHPDWLGPLLEASLGADYPGVMRAMRHRAALFLRVNRRTATEDGAIRALAEDGVAARPVDGSRFALEVIENARRVARSAAYRDGLVEIQDAASQAVIDLLDLPQAGAILDYCAGGGGKSLTMAALCGARLFAHDINRARLVDVPVRAARAGVRIAILDEADIARTAPFDLVLCDVPCSGSGTWRRNPEAKWSLDAHRLTALAQMQADILDRAARLVKPGGQLVYVTCSILEEENAAQVGDFLTRDPNFTLTLRQSISPLAGADGMFVAVMRHTQ